MGRHRCTRQVHNSLCLRAFPKDNLILKHYMFSAWWLHNPGVLIHYVIHLELVAQKLVINNSIVTLGYIYSNIRLKNPPDIFYEIAHIGRLIS